MAQYYYIHQPLHGPAPSSPLSFARALCYVRVPFAFRILDYTTPPPNTFLAQK
jgi:hypothetical protein